VRDFLQDRNVSVLPWPAKSPDLKPIEHVWDLLDRRVRARAIPPRHIWESGETSHSKNWQYLKQLVATPDTDCYF
jgi:transposase